MSNSAVVLFALRRNRRGDILMFCTRAFREVLRTRFGSPLGSTLRVGTIDFFEVRRNQYIGVPDQRDSVADAEVERLLSRILFIYRTLLTFEAVFSEEGSFDKWVTFHRRHPSNEDVLGMARERHIRVPYLALPFFNTHESPATMQAVLSPKTLERKVKIQLQMKIVPQPEEPRPQVVPVNASSLTAMIAAVNSKFHRV